MTNSDKPIRMSGRSWAYPICNQQKPLNQNHKNNAKPDQSDNAALDPFADEPCVKSMQRTQGGWRQQGQKSARSGAIRFGRPLHHLEDGFAFFQPRAPYRKFNGAMKQPCHQGRPQQTCSSSVPVTWASRARTRGPGPRKDADTRTHSR